MWDCSSSRSSLHHCSVTCPPPPPPCSQLHPQPSFRLFFTGIQIKHTASPLCSQPLASSIPSCLSLEPHPFLSTSREIQNPLESTERFLWPSRTLDPLLDKLRSSLKSLLHIKLSIVLASVVSHIPKVNNPPFPHPPALNVFSGVLLKEMVQWLH